MPLSMQSLRSLNDLGLETIRELEIPNGIMASDRNEAFGCIFGRDSLITSLKLLQAYQLNHDPYLLTLVKKILSYLAELQGKEINIESGEDPGKCIHEFRPDRHEHLTKALDRPWHVYPDGSLRNFDSLDATPLFLIAFFRYFEVSGDQAFIETYQENIERAITWLFEYGDRNYDGFFDYYIHPERKSGGLVVQNWMDSAESLFHEDESDVDKINIAPVEVQAYAYLALTLWSEYFESPNRAYAAHLKRRASRLKTLFNEKFVFADNEPFQIASSLDTKGKPLFSVRSSIGHILWASSLNKETKRRETILLKKHIPQLVKRLLAPDMFEPRAGIRTLSKLSKRFEANSYHNGSIWPHDTSMIIEGLENFGYREEAEKIRTALLTSFEYFQTPIELFGYDHNEYIEYRSFSGKPACKKQAWSAAALLVESLQALQEKQARS